MRTYTRKARREADRVANQQREEAAAERYMAACRAALAEYRALGPTMTVSVEE